MRRLPARQVDYSKLSDGLLQVEAGKLISTNLPGLDDLTDVDTVTTPPVDGDTLVFDAVSGVWFPGAAGSGGAASKGVGPAFVPMLPGRFYQSQITSMLSTVSHNSGRLLCTPFWLPGPTAFDALAIENTTTDNAATIGLAVYSADTAGRPSSLELDAGTTPVATAGAKILPVAATTLPAGLHWLATLFLGSAPVTVRAHSNQSSHAAAHLGFATAADTGNPITGYDYFNSYTAFPATLPVIAPNGTGVRPRVLARAA